MATFYITKWALTRGLLKVECSIYESNGGTSYATNKEERVFVRIGMDAFEDESKAKIRMRSLIDAKLKTLETSRKKLTKLREALA